MAQVKRYKARKDFKLDCGHAVKAGEAFVVTKTFTCELHAQLMPYKKSRPEEKGERQVVPSNRPTP